jgi:glutamate racemase
MIALQQKSPILLFGPDTGTSSLAALLKSDAPDVDTVCVDASSLDGARDKLLRAIGTYGPSAIILASNTLSLSLPDSLADDLGVPIYKVLPPLAEASRLTCTRHVALLAMPEVLAHPTTQKQISLFAERGLRVTPISALELAYMARRHHQNGLLPDIMALRDLTAPIRADARIDTVVLATTHATRLRGMLEKAAFRPFYWVDSTALAAKRFAALEANADILAVRHTKIV